MPNIEALISYLINKSSVETGESRFSATQKSQISKLKVNGRETETPKTILDCYKRQITESPITITNYIKNFQQFNEQFKNSNFLSKLSGQTNH